MRYHPGLKSSDLKAKGPSFLMLAIAAEFSRTANAYTIEQARSAYLRGRELFGVLETINLPEKILPDLLLIYRNCLQDDVFFQQSLTEIQSICREWSNQFISILENANHVRP